MPTRCHFTIAAAACAPFVASPLVAQTVSDTPDTILVLGRQTSTLDTPTSTGSRLGITPLETPASVTVLDGAAVRARDTSIVEAESRAPGFTSVATPGNGGTALAARGFSGQGSVLQLVDGVRLFPAAGTISFPTDPWMVDRIEILSGPASVLYGQGALGGAVNVTLRQSDAERTAAEAEIGYGSQRSFHAAAGVGGPIDPHLSYRVDASYRRSDGYVDRGRSRSVALSGALRWAPVDGVAVTLRDDYGDLQPSRYFGTPLVDGAIDPRIRHRNYNVADAEIRFRDNRTTLTAEWTPSDRLSITNTAYRLTSVRRYRNLERYQWVAGEDAVDGAIERSDNLGIVHDQTQWGNQASVRYRTPLGDGIENTLVAGFDANRIRLVYSHDFGSDPQRDRVDPFAFDPGRFLDTQGIAPRYRTRTDEAAVFVEDRIAIGTVSLVGGLRYEHDRVRRWTIDGAEGGEATESFVLDKTLEDTTWRVGAVYQPAATLSLYAQYTTGVDPLGTLTTYSTGPVAFSNATGDQVELGAKALFLGGRGSATFAAYRIVKKHLLAQQTPTSPVEQVGQRSATGIEASVALALPAGFGIDANGALLDADFDDFVSGGVDHAGKTPANIPEATANLWLRWDAAAVAQVRAGLRYVGRSWSDNANRYRIPGYAVIDAAVSAALAPHLAAEVRLTNLFDKDYAVTSYGDAQWLLGRPRAIDVSLRARF